MKKVFIAIDSGKHTTKGVIQVGETQHFTIFRTKVQQIENIGVDIQPNSYEVRFEGGEYLVGDMVTEDSQDSNISKHSLDHKIAIYTAIINLLNKANIDPRYVQIYLAINAPINMYKDRTKKEAFQSFLHQKNRLISIRVNGMAYMFRLEEVIVAFEGVGLIYEKPEQYANESTINIDIGGLNTNYCKFNGIQPELSSMVVNAMGINQLKSDIESELVRRYNVNVSANDLEKIIKDGYFMEMGQIHEESRKLIKKLKENHLDKLMNYSKKHGFTFNNANVQFVGGGSQLLSDEIREKFPNARIVANPQLANLRSFLQILKVKYQREPQLS